MKTKLYVDILIITFIISVVSSQSCPPWCTCSEIKTARCNSGEIKSILQSLPSQVAYLYLTAAQNSQYLKATDFGDVPSEQITHLTITQSNIEQIDNYTFAQTTNVEFLNLSRNNLKSLSKHAFSNLTKLMHLDLSFNYISQIGDELFPLFQLTELSLNENRLKELHTGSFSNQKNLHILKLDGNSLSKLHGYIFQGLGELRHLSLRRNGLSKIANDLFSVTRNLRSLDIGQNKLILLPTSVEFRSVPYLSVLNADHNDISLLKANQFSGMHLKTLNLSHNKIRSLAKSVFQYMNAVTLDLSYNQITDIAEEVFRSIINLEELILSHNRLGTFSDLVFNGLYRLRILNLSFCNLVQLSENLFLSLQSLDFLDISHNALQNLPEKAVNMFNTMQSVDISNNQWSCDCRLTAFKIWLDSYRSDILSCTGCVDARCHSPSELAHREIKSLSKDNLRECSPKPKAQSMDAGTAAGVSIACIFFVIVIVIAILLCWRHSKSPHFKMICRKSSIDSSHKDDIETGPRPFDDMDVGSVTESDRGFVVRNYFRTMVNNPSVVSRGSPPLSQKDIRNSDSMQSIDSTTVFSYPMGMESTV